MVELVEYSSSEATIGSEVFLPSEQVFLVPKSLQENWFNMVSNPQKGFCNCLQSCHQIGWWSFKLLMTKVLHHLVIYKTMINYILMGLQTHQLSFSDSMAFSDKISSPNFWVTCFLSVMRSHSLGWLVIQKRHPLLKHSEHFYINSRSFGWVSPKSESQFSELVHKQLMWSRWFLQTFDLHVMNIQ